MIDDMIDDASVKIDGKVFHQDVADRYNEIASAVINTDSKLKHR
jgi:hypothetical protein